MDDVSDIDVARAEANLRHNMMEALADAAYWQRVHDEQRTRAEKAEAEVSDLRDKLTERTKATDAYIKATSKTIADLRVKLAAVEDALTPSAETKVAYIGEFAFQIYDDDEDGRECVRLITVPWTTVKEIMTAIRARAAIAKAEERTS